LPSFPLLSLSLGSARSLLIINRFSRGLVLCLARDYNHCFQITFNTKHKGLVVWTSLTPTVPMWACTDSACPDSLHSTLAYVLCCALLRSFTPMSHSKEAQWLVHLFQDLKLAADKITPIPIYLDSSGVVSMVFNPVDINPTSTWRLHTTLCKGWNRVPSESTEKKFC